MDTSFVQAGDVTLYTESLGDPRHPTCLLIAGAGASARIWSDTFCAHLQDAGYRAIRYDHRDCGLSSAVDFQKNPYTVFDLVLDAKAILTFYGLQQVHVVGHSMGGIVAQLLALDHPLEVLTFTSLSVGTVSPLGKPSPTTMEFLMQQAPTGVFAFDLLGFMRSWYFLNGDIPLDGALVTAYTRDLYERSRHPVGVAWNHLYCQQALPDLSPRLHANTVPALFIHGAKDPLIPVHMGSATAHTTALSVFKEIPDMGHLFFNLDLETKLCSHLLDHFSSCLKKS